MKREELENRLEEVLAPLGWVRSTVRECFEDITVFARKDFSTLTETEEINEPYIAIFIIGAFDDGLKIALGNPLVEFTVSTVKSIDLIEGRFLKVMSEESTATIDMDDVHQVIDESWDPALCEVNKLAIASEVTGRNML